MSAELPCFSIFSQRERVKITHSRRFSVLLVCKKKLARQLIRMHTIQLLQAIKTNNITEFVSEHAVNVCDMQVFYSSTQTAAIILIPSRHWWLPRQPAQNERLPSTEHFVYQVTVWWIYWKKSNMISQNHWLSFTFESAVSSSDVISAVTSESHTLL